MNKILVVDDEGPMRQLIRIYLQNAGYSVEEAADGRAALERFEKDRPQLVVLDLMMPGMDGFETCGHMREMNREIPILMLTARTTIEDKVAGLSCGADDYLTKPFDGRELVARVQTLLRRVHLEEEQTLEVGGVGLKIDLAGRTVTVGGTPIALTPKEFEMLVLLSRRPGRTFTREEILERVWNYEYEGEPRTVDSHVKNLREKLRDAGIIRDPLKTVWGVGYKFEVGT
ncbi:response regulator transcription factor [Alicyclobacillus curvatus]|nr:response regulator transcription factor [Alicyclobacillus curvatus]